MLSTAWRNSAPRLADAQMAARRKSELDNGERVLLNYIQGRNGCWLNAEMDKLERWAEDRAPACGATSRRLEQQMRETRRAARQAPSPPDKLSHEHRPRELEARRDQAELDFRAASRELDRQNEKLIGDIAQRINAAVSGKNSSSCAGNCSEVSNCHE